MHVLKIFSELLFPMVLGLTALCGLLALISPQAFAAATTYGGRLVRVTNIPTRFDKWIDIDRYVLKHGRFFGFLVTGSAAYLWLLSAFGPAAISKPFLVTIVGASLTTSILSLIEMRKQRQEIETRALEAHTDPLTGLANRRSFDIELTRRLAQRQRQGTPLCLVIIDIDYFKRINDSRGHQVGDAILKNVAGILHMNAPSMAIVSRIGGDEFAIGIAGSNLDDATAAAERLRKAICRQPLVAEGSEHPLTVSIGVAEALSDDDTTSLFKRADSALYAAKDCGRNQTFRQGSPEPATPVPCA